MLKFLDTIGIPVAAALPVTGSTGEIIFYGGSFYGWTGSAWESLNTVGVTNGDKGDITVSAAGATWTIDPSTITLAKLANLAANSFIGNNTGSTATPLALTGTQATALLDLAVAGGAKGLLSGTDKTKLDAITGANTGDQTITLTGNVTGSGTGSFATTISTNVVTDAMLAQIATGTFKGRSTAGTGNVEVLTATQATALLNLVVAAGAKGLMSGSDKTKLDAISGTNTGDQTITLTGDITGSGTGSFATTIGANKVTLGNLAQVVTASFLGRSTAATGNVESLTATQATALLDAFSTTTKGLVPAPTTSTGRYLKDDGTWTAITAASSNSASWVVTASSTGASQNLTLPENGLSPGDVLLTIGGLIQEPADYTISGTTLTVTALDTGISIMARRLLVPLSLATTPYSIPISFTFTPATSEVLHLQVFAEAITLPSNFAGFARYVGTNPTASFVLTLKKNGTSIGTLTVSTSGVVTGSTSGAISFAVNDVLTAVGPATVDSTIQNCGFTLKAARV